MLEFDLNYLIKREEKYGANSFDGTYGNPIKYLDGRNPILISAPHSVNQNREGKLKMGERYTGTIAEILSEHIDCHMITKLCNDGIDDNYILYTRYKDTIGDIIDSNDIKFVLDLHGMLSSTDAGFRGYHIEIGSNYGKNLLNDRFILDLIIDSLNKYNIKDLKVDYKFKASKPYTVSNYIANNFNTPALQLEISSDYRNPVFNIKNFNLLINSLINFLNSLLKIYRV
ncbi:MAG: hypothetical protein Q4P31_04435 [Andreesenia angusta]|nr:hypothetical protein [Andreesenia angusta]